MSKKKKIVILSVMFVLLVVTGYLNIALNKTNVTTTSSENVVTGNFFVTYRTDRQSTREQEIAYYDAIISSASSSTEAKANAEAKKEELVYNMEMELVTEGLIKARGFDDVVVTSASGCVNVIVKTATLSSNEVAQIVSIVQEQANVGLDNIKIIPVD